ncbi:F-box protein At3g07870-like [Papaver somniferum]|uniref:F-box protein At3g07870-like n=1 Tax=Papaver somniferum TaxID=3469 RepID=UPI000E6FA534|nr:F-box protein At3g07870-like [Papaver somniferum]
MDVIPAEIAIEIFSRVPAETILECESVCKTWQNLLSLDKKFIDMHFRRQQDLLDHHEQKVSLGLIFLCKSKNLSGHELFYGEYDQTNNNNNSKEECSIPNTVRLINHPPVRSQKNYSTRLLVGSCNGLICLAEPRMYGVKDPIHICNPITRECSNLQGFNETNDYHHVTCIHSGFGYSAETNEYKVVRILYSFGAGTADLQVYTLAGGSGWRKKGVVTYMLSEEHGVFVNGAIHWLDMNEEDTMIMAFNLSDEGGDCLDIWTFKKTSSGTTTSITVGNNKYESWSWCKEFSIDLEGSSSWDNVPVAFTKTGLLVLWYADLSIVSEKGTFYSYNPKTATW